jgi:hypothetical protein
MDEGASECKARGWIRERGRRRRRGWSRG